jgi:hypothetical protein
MKYKGKHPELSLERINRRKDTIPFIIFPGVS